MKFVWRALLLHLEILIKLEIPMAITMQLFFHQYREQCIHWQLKIEMEEHTSRSLQKVDEPDTSPSQIQSGLEGNKDATTIQKLLRGFEGRKLFYLMRSLKYAAQVIKIYGRATGYKNRLLHIKL